MLRCKICGRRKTGLDAIASFYDDHRYCDEMHIEEGAEEIMATLCGPCLLELTRGSDLSETVNEEAVRADPSIDEYLAVTLPAHFLVSGIARLLNKVAQRMSQGEAIYFCEAHGCSSLARYEAKGMHVCYPCRKKADRGVVLHRDREAEYEAPCIRHAKRLLAES